MEYLQDASCRKCSLETTLKALALEIETLKHQSRKQKNDTKKKRETIVQLVAIEKAKRDIEYRLNVGRIEEEGDHDKLPLLRSVSRMSSKQVMLAKPPKILCLHISRSAFLNTGAIYKNTCQLLFPEYLDIAPFSTNGTLHTQPNLPISTTTLSTTTENQGDRRPVYYKLMSVVVHYGSHSFGHFIAYKRRIYAEQCRCHECIGNAQLSASEKAEDWKCQNTWYRISDSKVDECSIEDVRRSNPYMLLYELVSQEELDKHVVNDQAIDGEEDQDALSDIEDKQDTNTSTPNDDAYTNIPTGDATKEALRIATALLMQDQK